MPMMEFPNVSSYYDDVKCKLIKSIVNNRTSEIPDSYLNVQYIFQNITESECIAINLKPEIGSIKKDDLMVAWAAWSLMDHDDRTEVISFFCHYYARELFGKSLQEKTFIFCSLFLEQFVPLLNI